VAPIRATFAIKQTGFVSRRTDAIHLIIPVDQTVAIIVDPISAIRFFSWRRSAVGRAITRVLSWVADSVLTNRRRTTVDCAVDTVLSPFAEAVSAAVTCTWFTNKFTNTVVGAVVAVLASLTCAVVAENPLAYVICFVTVWLRTGIEAIQTTRTGIACLCAVAEQTVVTYAVVRDVVAYVALLVARVVGTADTIIAVDRRAGLAIAGGIACLCSVAERAVVTCTVVGGVFALVGCLVARIDGTVDIIITVDRRTGLAVPIGIAGLLTVAVQTIIALNVR
jgi:hypothetical protein